MSFFNRKEKFANNLIKYRKENNLTQEELSLKCGLHRNYISDLETIKRNPSIKSIEKIAKALNLDAYLLLK